MASKYRKKCSLPVEFYPILESYSREVLRDQPLDIIEYSYLYFKAMEEGTLDSFDYPKKGANIPPSKHGKPEPEPQQMQQQDQEEEYDQEGQIYGEEQREEEGEDQDQDPNGNPYYDETNQYLEGQPGYYGQEEVPDEDDDY